MRGIKEETIKCTLREGPPELSALFICLSVYMLVCHFVIICHISLGGMQDHTIFEMRRRRGRGGSLNVKVGRRGGVCPLYTKLFNI